MGKFMNREEEQEGVRKSLKRANTFHKFAILSH